ncbi:hypothetical protein BREVUG8_90089 [Brevundimonas sp. G8]|nr:hypothetical protein BREVUG8_90089 [Brevundimonas sp. G8]
MTVASLAVGRDPDTTTSDPNQWLMISERRKSAIATHRRCLTWRWKPAAWTPCAPI